MTVVELHQEKPCKDVVQALRNIIDQIESGEIEWPVTTCVVMLGYCGAERPRGEAEYTEEVHWRTYGVGPRNDTFTVRGLIASVLRSWDGNDD